MTVPESHVSDTVDSEARAPFSNAVGNPDIPDEKAAHDFDDGAPDYKEQGQGAVHIPDATEGEKIGNREREHDPSDLSSPLSLNVRFHAEASMRVHDAD